MPAKPSSPYDGMPPLDDDDDQVDAFRTVLRAGEASALLSTGHIVMDETPLSILGPSTGAHNPDALLIARMTAHPVAVRRHEEEVEGRVRNGMEVEGPHPCPLTMLDID